MARAWLARGAALAAVAGVAIAALVAAPTNAASAPLVLTVNGDVGMSTRTVAALDTIAAIKPAAHLAVGDLSYGVTGQEQAFCDLVTSRLGAGFPYELLTGNHESNGQNGNINDFGACLPNQLPGIVGTYGRQWYVDLPRESPKVRVLLISPGLTFPTGTLTYASGTPEYSWTANTIDAARAANIPWVIVGMHKPCLSLGNYGCDVGADLMNLLVDKKVDLVLTGHEHLYQRTKQVASAPGCPTVSAGAYNSACVADSDSDLVKGSGTVFVTAGTGGQEYRDSFPSDPEAGYFVTASSLAAPALGALKLSIVDDSLTGQFVATAPTTFTDSLTITKAPAPTGSPSVSPTVTPTVTPTGPPAPTPLAGDTFTRIVTSGWGTADLGGLWTPESAASVFSTDGAAARIAIAAGATRVATLPVSVQDATFSATIRWSQLPPAGINYYAFAVARRTAALTDYRVRVRALSDGTVRIGVIALDGTWTARTIGAEVLMPGLSMAANAPVRLRYSVSGVSPTTIKVFATLPGQLLPVTPQLVVTDSQPSLQMAGRVGVGGTIGSTSPTATLAVDDIEVTAP